MTMTGKTHLDYVIRRHYGGDATALAKEVWIQTHPALIEARKQVDLASHLSGEAAHGAAMVARLLQEMWEEAHEAIFPMPDEGNVLPKTEVRDRGREVRLASIERQHHEDEHELRITLKAAIAKYGVKVPDKVQKNSDNTMDALDETFGHLLDARDQLLFQLHEKYGASRLSAFEGATLGCDAIMDGDKPRLEVTMFVPPDGIEVPSVFCDFPVTVVEGKQSESKEDVDHEESFPDENSC